MRQQRHSPQWCLEKKNSLMWRERKYSLHGLEIDSHNNVSRELKDFKQKGTTLRRKEICNKNYIN